LRKLNAFQQAYWCSTMNDVIITKRLPVSKLKIHKYSGFNEKGINPIAPDARKIIDVTRTAHLEILFWKATVVTNLETS
jgi:hypothetical protein